MKSFLASSFLPVLSMHLPCSMMMRSRSISLSNLDFFSSASRWGMAFS